MNIFEFIEVLNFIFNIFSIGYNFGKNQTQK